MMDYQTLRLEITIGVWSSYITALKIKVWFICRRSFTKSLLPYRIHGGTTYAN